MTQAPSQASETAQLPTIIIDPSLYEPDAPRPKQTTRSDLGRLARVTLLVGAVGGATYGVAHLPYDGSFSQDPRVAALTKRVGLSQTDAVLQARLDEPRSADAAKARASAVETPGRVEALDTRDTLDTSAEAQLIQVPNRYLAPMLVETEPALPEPDLDAVAPVAAAAVVAPSALISAAALPLAKRAPETEGSPAASAPRMDLEAKIRNARRLQALNQIDEAELAYQAVLAQSPEQTAALVGLARIKLARGELDAALDFARRAMDKAPEQTNVHLTLGDVLRARGDQQGAQAEYALAR